MSELHPSLRYLIRIARVTHSESSTRAILLWLRHLLGKAEHQVGRAGLHVHASTVALDPEFPHQVEMAREASRGKPGMTGDEIRVAMAAVLLRHPQESL